MPRLRPAAAIALLAGLGLGLTACGGSPSAAGTTSVPAGSAATTTTSAPAASSTTAASAATTGTGAPLTIGTIPAADRSPAGKPGHQPTVVVPAGKPPTRLEVADLIPGTGAVAKNGDLATVQYVLATYSSHKVVQSSWTSQPFQFTLGAGQVIPGWDAGVVGMKVGGRRELIIPPALGYKSQSPGPGIAANDTLVFVVDLLKLG